MFGGDFGLPPGPRYERRSTGGTPPVVYLCHAVAPRRPSCRIVELVPSGALASATSTSLPSVTSHLPRGGEGGLFGRTTWKGEYSERTFSQPALMEIRESEDKAYTLVNNVPYSWYPTSGTTPVAAAVATCFAMRSPADHISSEARSAYSKTTKAWRSDQDRIR